MCCSKWQKCLLERDVLTVLCPAAAESPAYHTLERKDKNREGNYHADLQSMDRHLETLFSWIISTVRPMYIISTISSLAVVVKQPVRRSQGKQKWRNVKENKSIRICDKQARLGRSQPKQSVEFKIKVRKEVRDHLWTTKGVANRCLVKRWGRRQKHRGKYLWRNDVIWVYIYIFYIL